MELSCRKIIQKSALPISTVEHIHYFYSNKLKITPMKLIELWVTEFPVPIYVNANCIEQIYPGGPETVLVKLTSGRVYELDMYSLEGFSSSTTEYEIASEELVKYINSQL